jgi:RNA polymerase-binding transcription factor DksA
MITRAEAAVYRQRLLGLLSRLGRNQSQLRDEALRGAGGETSGSLSDAPVHPADLGSHEFEEGLTLGLLENEDLLVEAINDALGRIEQGTYGRCEECGHDIAKERLQVLPYTRHCVACARLQQGETTT